MRAAGLVLLAVALAGCEHAEGEPDATVPGPCMTRGGLRLRLVFDAPGPGGAGGFPGWTDLGPLHVSTTGAGAVAFELTPDRVGTDRVLPVLLDWPPGTASGSGAVSFLGSSGGAAVWQSSVVTFTYDVSDRRCAEILLEVHYVGAPPP